VSGKFVYSHAPNKMKKKEEEEEKERRI